MSTSCYFSQHMSRHRIIYIPNDAKRIIFTFNMNPESYLITRRPTKRRRTKRDRLLTQDDAQAADGIAVKTVIRSTENGLVEESIEVPVWINRPVQPSIVDNPTELKSFPADVNNEDLLNEDLSADYTSHSHADASGPSKTQPYYIQEFLSRVHPMLKALLSREDLSPNTSCARCSKGNIAAWRCKDCTAARPLCRGCMRDCHMECPTHRIEVWNGSHYRAAELWEVGLYILVNHHIEPRCCPTLKFQTETLAVFQRHNDDMEQLALAGRTNTGSSCRGMDTNYEKDNILPDIFPDSGTNDLSDNNDDDDKYDTNLDNLYRQRQEGLDINDNEIEDFRDEYANNSQKDDDFPLPSDYMPNLSAENVNTVGDVPRFDALNNPYVRIVHTNGVHHIALVYCSCHGKENTHADLMAAGLFPTSFSRYRTVFTHAILDDFRISNLECKTSAYQYFQKLRRQTSQISPDSVPNLYHELRRISRLWRWMKKLKWAGFGHRSEAVTDINPLYGHQAKTTPEVKPGELANFCPTCPQPGINLPRDWKADPERWVYKRSYVADGNFKADHIRQPHITEDIWLSEGGGMTSKRVDYEGFLRHAIERSTVSGFDLTRGRT